MTNPVMEEIHRLATAAIDGGESHVPIHVFPFRMTDENMKTQGKPAWNSFWANLKEGYDVFEKTKRPPRVSACDGRYTFGEAPSASDAGPLEACVSTIANIKEQDQWLDGLSANAPVRTAAAMPATAADAPGDARSLTDAVMNDDLSSEPEKGAAPQAAAKPEPAPEPVLRCRYAHKVCRKAITLKGVQAARQAARLAAGLRRILLSQSREVRADNLAQ